MRTGLTIPDLGDFVALPLLGVLATYRRDGTVLLSPVWHEYRDGGFNICTDSNGGKAKHLRRDPRAVLVIAEAAPPYRGLELATEAKFVNDDLPATIKRVATRYLGDEGAERYAEAPPDDIIVRLEPGRIRAWDFADEWG